LNQERSAPAQELNLAGILNILWRRRLIVIGLPALGLLVGLGYGIFGTRRWEATVTIRPGITAFGPDGGPVREWRLKDITRWYDQKLYRKELVRRLGLPAKARPVIRAEFIAQGLQNLAGGDLITLWTTATSPDLAAAILDTSVAIFSQYAEVDTISSNLKLTRDGLLIQIRNLEIQLDAVEKDLAALDLRLQSALAESLHVVAENKQLGLDLDKLVRQEAYYERRLQDLKDLKPTLAEDLAQLDVAVRRLAAGEVESVDPQEIPSWVRRDAVLDGGNVLEALSGAKLQVQNALAANQALQDSLALAAEVSRLERARLEIEREAAIRSKVQDVRRKIGDLHLERDYDLPAKRLALQNSIEERRVKLGTIAPLQRVGATVTSDDPVRPRTLRAIVILVFLGAAGGLALGVTWDYLAAHRREIFRT